MPRNKKVLVVGLGAMGKIHAKKIQDLHPELIAVVDLKVERLQEARAAGYLAYPTLEAAYAEHKQFDVAVITTNTAEHAANIRQIISYSLTYSESLPDLFVEKPIVATQAEVAQLLDSLVTCGYDANRVLMSGYLLRESPAVARLLEKIKADGANVTNVTNVTITWQKQRKSDRASAGVIQDEVTHSLDLVQYILRLLTGNVAAHYLSINSAVRSRKIVNEIEQDLLYKDPLDPNRNPFAEISYAMNFGNVAVTGFSSFLTGPQERSIVFIAEVKGQPKKYKLVFDDKGCDRCDDEVFVADKIALLWQSFLTATQSATKPQHIASIYEAFRDVALTSGLEELANQFAQRPAKLLTAWNESQKLAPGFNSVPTTKSTAESKPGLGLEPKF